MAKKAAGGMARVAKSGVASRNVCEKYLKRDAFNRKKKRRRIVISGNEAAHPRRNGGGGSSVCGVGGGDISEMAKSTINNVVSSRREK